jgi:hypothetical protein
MMIFSSFMRLFAITSFALSCISFSVLAEEIEADVKQGEKENYCDRAAISQSHTHHMHPDVAHTPNDDVHYGGKNKAFDIMDPVTIPISLDVIKSMGLDVYDGLEGNANLANVQVYRDGRIVYNSIDITDRFNNLCDEE